MQFISEYCPFCVKKKIFVFVFQVTFQKQTFFVGFLGISGMALIILANFIDYDLSPRIVIYTERIHSEYVSNKNSRLRKFTENPETHTTRHSINRHKQDLKIITPEVKKTKMESSSTYNLLNYDFKVHHQSVQKITSGKNTTEEKELESSSPSIFEYKTNCTYKPTDVEDILCMVRQFQQY